MRRPRARRSVRWIVVVLALGVVAVGAAILTGRESPSAAPPHPRFTSRRCPPGVAALRAGGKLRRHAPCPSVDPSGELAPTGDLPGWRLVFVDDFHLIRRHRIGQGPRWKAYRYPWRDTSRNGTYWPQRGLSAHDGVLDIWLHTEKVDGTDVHVVNAPQPVIPGVERGQLYGRYAIRFKANQVDGYKTAWLLWPDSGHRNDGEIDFPEGNLTGTISAFLHPVDARSESDKSAFSTKATYRRWHTAVIVWAPGRCKFILDGKVIGVVKNRTPDTPMHWVIQTETRLSGGAPPDDVSGHVYIDWVAVYARA